MLARIASDTVASELAEAKAAVAELEASANEAKGNAERARELREGLLQRATGGAVPDRRPDCRRALEAARARQRAAEVKMGKTGVLAPDDGIVSGAHGGGRLADAERAGTVPSDPRRPSRMARRGAVGDAGADGAGRRGDIDRAGWRARLGCCAQRCASVDRRRATGWSMSICPPTPRSRPACSREANSNWAVPRR